MKFTKAIAYGVCFGAVNLALARALEYYVGGDPLMYMFGALIGISALSHYNREVA